MADSLDVDVPWIMCQQAASPKPMLETCYDWYFDENQKTLIPVKRGLKIGLDGLRVGWCRPFRTAKDLSYFVTRIFQKGGTLQNYYM
ncbi:hypothetical protein Goari_001522, partial [Gossypium aridum]|nr:hypothetical protein [Gossypium aridum]